MALITMLSCRLLFTCLRRAAAVAGIGRCRFDNANNDPQAARTVERPFVFWNPMSLTLYDNWTRSLRPFEPLQPGHVGMYTCGPTVYDYQHIGNLRTYLFEDGLKRVLRLNGDEGTHVTNI